MFDLIPHAHKKMHGMKQFSTGFEKNETKRMHRR
jgi:hypothetical protein